MSYLVESVSLSGFVVFVGLKFESSVSRRGMSSNYVFIITRSPGLLVRSSKFCFMGRPAGASAGGRG